jgi:hypothetical protein
MELGNGNRLRVRPNRDACAIAYYSTSGTILNYCREIQGSDLLRASDAGFTTSALTPKEFISLIRLLCIVELTLLIRPFR